RKCRVPRAMRRVVDAITDGDRAEVIASLVRPAGRCGRSLDVAGFELLWILEMPRRDLEIPLRVRLEPDPAREGVHPAEIEVPPILVGLPTVEHRAFERQRPS